MIEIKIQVGQELERFETFEQWLSHAKRKYEYAYFSCGSQKVITLDSANPKRVVSNGKEFRRARDESTFPVVIYALEETK